MKWPQSPPPMPASSAETTKARQRKRGMCAPRAAAAISSSRVARSSSPVRDSLKASATASAATATAAASGSVVALGRPKSVRGPLVTLDQLVITLCSTTRSANEVMTAAASESRISG